MCSSDLPYPPARIERALDLAHSLLASDSPHEVRVVAQVKGLLVSMWLGVGEHARIRTRSLGKVVDSRLRPGEDPSSRVAWRRKVQMTPEAIAELRFWDQHLLRIDGRPISSDWLDGAFDGTIATDASDTGFGGWVSLEGRTSDESLPLLAEKLLKQAGRGFSVRSATRSVAQGLEVWGPLPQEMLEERASSTLREIYGAFSLLSLLANILSGGRFRMHFDNMCCVMGLGGKVPPSATGGKAPRSVLGGSRVDAVQAYIIKILDLACAKNIQLVAIWVPRAENERSDLLSRMSAIAQAEYCLSDRSYARIESQWGPHTLDVFSIYENVRVASGRFMSKFYHEQIGRAHV